MRVSPATSLFLEAVDRGVPARPRGARSELPDANRDDVLVVGAVEDPDDAGVGEAPPDPPQEVVAAFLGSRRAERGDAHPLRIHLTHDVADRASLAGRVEALQHEQHAACTARAPLGEQPFLEIGEPRGQLLLRLPRRRLAALEPRGGTRVDATQVDRARSDTQSVADPRRHGPKTTTS